MWSGVRTAGRPVSSPSAKLRKRGKMTETQTLCNGRWLRLMRRGRWEYAERTNPGGGVIIIAVTPEDRIVFVEQWREAVRSKTIEMPAGLVGDLAGGAN